MHLSTSKNISYISCGSSQVKSVTVEYRLVIGSITNLNKNEKFLTKAIKNQNFI